jgi:hypothetical protein
VRMYEALLKSHGIVVSVTSFDADTRNRCAEILENSGALEIQTDQGSIVNLQASM